MKKKSQKENVLEYLRQGHTLTAIEAFERGWGMRLASVINILRKEGHIINTEHITNKFNTSYGKYSLNTKDNLDTPLGAGFKHKDIKNINHLNNNKESKAKLLLKMKKYDNVKFKNDLKGNRYFKIGYFKPINNEDQYYIQQHSKLKFKEERIWDEDCGYKYWYSLI